MPCGHLGLRRPPDQSSRPRCFRVCRTPTPFPFGAVVLTRRAFGGCSRGMAGTEVEKGNPRPRLPLPPGCFGGRRKPGNFLRVSGSSRPLSFRFRRPRPPHSPACWGQREGSAALGSLPFPPLPGAEASMPVAETKAPGLGWARGGWEAGVGALQSGLCSLGQHRAAAPRGAASPAAGLSGVSPCEAQRSSLLPGVCSNGCLGSEAR